MVDLTDPRFFAVVHHFENSCRASREHKRLTIEALERFGDHGPQISGCMRDHFPPAVKNRLRALAREVSAHSDLARKARPRYVHMATINEIGRAVTRRDGGGFYGFLI